MEFHHSSLLAGEDVACAGHMKNTAQMLKINLESGHYQPTTQHMYNAVKALKDKGVPLDLVIVVPVYGDKNKGTRCKVFFEGINGIKAGKTEEDQYVKALIQWYLETQYVDPENKKEIRNKTKELKEMVGELMT